MKRSRRAGKVGSDGGTGAATQHVGLEILVFGFCELSIVWGMA